MKLISIKADIKGIREQYYEQYKDELEGDFRALSTLYDPKLIYKSLLNLDLDTATAKDITKIMGNDSWADPTQCDECGEEKEMVVQLGEEPDYESATAIICYDCLKAALDLIERER